MVPRVGRIVQVWILLTALNLSQRVTLNLLLGPVPSLILTPSTKGTLWGKDLTFLPNVRTIDVPPLRFTEESK